MCLISIAPEGVEKYEDHFKNILRNAMRSHSDGSGYAYLKKGEEFVNWHKGFFTFDAMWKSLLELELKKEDILVVHSRTATVGEVKTTNCHPFLLAPYTPSTIHQISITKGKTKEGVLFHNGGFTGYRDDSNISSDTAHFTHSVFSGCPEMYDLLIKREIRFQNILKSVINHNKITILTPNKLINIGSFIKDVNGYFHSNGSYDSSEFKTRGTTYNMYDEHDSFYGAYAHISHNRSLIAETIEVSKFNPLIKEEEEEKPKTDDDLPKELESFYQKIPAHNLDKYYYNLKQLFHLNLNLINKFIALPKFKNYLGRFEKFVPLFIFYTENDSSDNDKKNNIGLRSKEDICFTNSDALFHNCIVLPKPEFEDEIFELIKLYDNTNWDKRYESHLYNVLKHNLNSEKANIKKPIIGSFKRDTIKLYYDYIKKDGYYDTFFNRVIQNPSVITV